MLQPEFDAIVSNAAGCGSTMKEYGDLLEHDPAYAARARQFVAKVRDITEYLDEIGLVPPKRKLRSESPTPIPATWRTRREFASLRANC